MPAAEILYRLKLKILAPRIHKAILKESLPTRVDKIVRSANSSIKRLPADLALLNIGSKFLVKEFTEAEDELSHTISLFGKPLQLGDKVNWYRDYSTGFECPKLEYTKLNYRNPKQTGNIMYIWWLNRHQHLAPDAFAYYLSQDEKYATDVLAQIQQWLNDCPYPMGPAWLTGIEAGIRLLTWSWIYKLLFSKGYPDFCSDELLESWFVSIRQHVRFIDSHWAKYSSANNHTIAEAVGIIAAATTWPDLFPSKSLLKRSAKILVEEAFLQNSSDGVNKESATSYHAFVLELLTNACLLYKPVKEALAELVDKMADLLRSLTCECDYPPEIGDSDNAVATGIFERGKDYYKSVFIAAKNVAGISPKPSEDCPCNIGNYSSKTYAIYNSPPDSDFKTKLCMNVGGLGYGNLAAHGHADALALTLHVNGEPVFIDPGTYSYHDEPDWRDYFRGTRAHNTLLINHSNQAEILGPFLWGEKYSTDIIRSDLSENNFGIEAEHFGYLKRFGVKHRREVVKSNPKKWVIKDKLAGNGVFYVELLYHIHPDRKVEQISEYVFRISGTAFFVVLTLPSHLHYRIAKGEISPPLGWFSPVLHQKIPSPTIFGEGTVNGCDNLFSRIEIM